MLSSSAFSENLGPAILITYASSVRGPRTWSTRRYVPPRGSTRRLWEPCFVTNRPHLLAAILPPIPAVEALRLSGGVASHIAFALEHTANSEEVTDVFPVLNLIDFEEGDYEDYDSDDEPMPVGSEVVERFFSSRQRSGRPVTIVNPRAEHWQPLW